MRKHVFQQKRPTAHPSIQSKTVLSKNFLEHLISLKKPWYFDIFCFNPELKYIVQVPF